MKGLAAFTAVVAIACLLGAPGSASAQAAAPPGPAWQQSHIPGSVVIRKRLAMFEARLALKRRFGRAYENASAKRLTCRRRLSDLFRCSFSFRHGGKRRAGTVVVEGTRTGFRTTVHVR
jgi:hypothetical protein